MIICVCGLQIIEVGCVGAPLLSRYSLLALHCDTKRMGNYDITRGRNTQDECRIQLKVLYFVVIFLLAIMLF